MRDARNNKRLYDWEKEPCKNCKMYKTYEGHDGCIGELDGLMNACCGHGNIEKAYVQFFDGTRIGGEDAIVIQSILKRRRSGDTLVKRLKALRNSVSYLEENIFEYFSK